MNAPNADHKEPTIYSVEITGAVAKIKKINA